MQIYSKDCHKFFTTITTMILIVFRGMLTEQLKELVTSPQGEISWQHNHITLHQVKEEKFHLRRMALFLLGTKRGLDIDGR
jgi:hypothetical protein